MFSTGFSFTPVHGLDLPALSPLNNPFLEMYAQQTRRMINLQMTFADMATLGLINDLRQELEHSMVEGMEGMEGMEELYEKIHALQCQTASEETKNLLTQEAINDAQTHLKSVLSKLTTSMFTLPFSRRLPKPSRKRFPITVEGEVVKSVQ